MPDISGILFDKDGTLIDYHLSWGPVNRKAARWASGGDAVLEKLLLVAGGLDSDTGRVRAGSPLAAGDTNDIAKAWCDAGCRVPTASLVRELDRMFLSAADAAVPVTDLAAFFTRLKARNLRIGIASNDSEEGIHATMRRLVAPYLVDFVSGYDSGNGAKPGPGMLHAFCAATGVRASETVVVGDNRHDMEMARRGGAGLAVSVLTGTGQREDLEGISDHCLASISDLEGFLFD